MSEEEIKNISDEEFDILETKSNFSMEFKNKYTSFFIDNVPEDNVYTLSKKLSSYFSVIDCYYMFNSE